jgi:membrane protease YdiL (CAAX protease family)
MYLPALVSVDFFASASGAFTDVSIPTSIGVSFKQVIQIILLYAGLIFDGVFLVYGINSHHTVLGFAVVTILNVLFGSAFLGLTGVWLYPCGGKNPESEDFQPDIPAAKRRYTSVGIALASMYLGIHVGQLLLSDKGGLIGTYLPIYCIGFPLFLIVNRILSEKDRPSPPAVNPLPIRRFLIIIPACFFVMYLGNIVGSGIQGIVYSILPAPLIHWGAADASMQYPVLQALLLAVAAPVMEELVFRRTVIPQLLPYGEKAALVMSALMFALFHSSVSQACYAFLLGLVFGYVYIRTGRLRYSMILHVLINSMTSIVLPALMMLASMSANGQSAENVPLSAVMTQPGVIALIMYVALLLVWSLFGAVVFFFAVRNNDLSGDSIKPKTVFTSWGILLFIALACTTIL